MVEYKFLYVRAKKNKFEFKTTKNAPKIIQFLDMKMRKKNEKPGTNILAQYNGYYVLLFLFNQIALI